jgi:hypothetical protein
MNQICIAKKLSYNNVEFLDFAINSQDQDKLMTFATYKEAHKYLKSEVEKPEELLDFIITTIDAQKDNPRMKELLALGTSNQAPTTATPPSAPVADVSSTTEEVECYFLLDCSNFEILNNDSIIERATNRQLIPVLAFVDATNPESLVQAPNFKLKQAYIGVAKDPQ